MFATAYSTHCPRYPFIFFFRPQLKPDITFYSLLQFHHYHKRLSSFSPTYLILSFFFLPFSPIMTFAPLKPLPTFYLTRPLYLWRAISSQLSLTVNSVLQVSFNSICFMVFRESNAHSQHTVFLHSVYFSLASSPSAHQLFRRGLRKCRQQS